MFFLLIAALICFIRTASTGESFTFKAETSRLLDIIVNSLYSDREVFVRELVSNAVDSLEKLRYLSLTDVKLLGDENVPLEIRISADPRKKILVIEDTGIGMDHDELVRNLGTIAESGTSKFFNDKEQEASSLIGQFGVGFFSSFLVANRVDFETIRSPKGNGDYSLGKPLRWSSDAVSEFTITEIGEDEEDVINHRGSRIVLHLRDDALQFCQEKRLEALLKKYSGFMSFPIYLRHEDAIDVEEDIINEEPEETEKKVITDENGEEIEVAEEAEDQEKSEEEEKAFDKEEENSKKSEEDEELDDDEDEFDKEEKEAEKKRKEAHQKKIEESKKANKRVITKYEYKWNEVATGPSIWMKMPNEVTEEEYNEFYAKALKSADKTIKDEKPIAWSHFRGEGSGADFRALIYIPESAPENFYERYNEQHSAIRLYINKVFVTNDTDDMLPHWLRFVRGVVDSENLSINLSREMIQESRSIKKIGQRIANTVIRKITALFKDSFEPIEEEKIEEETPVEEKQEENVEQEKIEETTASEEDDYVEDAFENEDKKEEEKKEEKKKSRDDELTEMVKPYHKFFKSFGRTLKFANLEEDKNRNKLVDLMMFMTSKTPELQYPETVDDYKNKRDEMIARFQRDGPDAKDFVNFVSFQQYVDRMPKYQEDIYIISGLTIQDTLDSPYIKAAVKRGIEVIILYDPIDDFIFQNNLKEYKDKSGKVHNIKNISKSDVQLPEPEDFEKEDDSNLDDNAKLTKKYGEELLNEYLRKNIENVSQVKASDKLSDDDVPVMVTTASWAISATQERVLKAQYAGAANQLSIFKNQRHLDYNAKHPMIVAMKDLLVTLNPMVLEPKVNEEKKKEWEKHKKEAEEKQEEFTEPEPEPELKYTVPTQIKDTPELARAAYCLGNTAMYYAGYEVEKKTDFVKSMFSVVEDAVKLKKSSEDKVTENKEEEKQVAEEVVEEVKEEESIEENIEKEEEVIIEEPEKENVESCGNNQIQQAPVLKIMEVQGLAFALPTVLALSSIILAIINKVH